MYSKVLSFGGTLVLAGVLVFVTADTTQAAPHGGGGHFSGGHFSGGHLGGAHFGGGHFSGGHLGGAHFGGAHFGGINGGAFRGGSFNHAGSFSNGGYRGYGYRNNGWNGYRNYGWNGYPSYGWSGYPSSSLYSYPSYGLYSYPNLGYSSGGYDDPYLGSYGGSLYSSPYLGDAGSSFAVPDLGTASGSYEETEPPAVTVLPNPGPAAVEPDRTARVTVTVPADAEVWFEGVKMTEMGIVRAFQSPPLTPDRRFTYTVKARWEQNGRAVTQTQTVRVFAGASVNVVFPTSSTTALRAANRRNERAPDRLR